ncbi:spermatogenesis-associated protein 6 [Dromiciops gliroides]|uniref:spermatogenesis-associated protein 6 n=1 Tax=Dromiciops gliroides TaxID=33562 RepID=UPI001CC37FD3|nr:spermatogenesis-associated protein 6 [Dromiciops gliroides]
MPKMKALQCALALEIRSVSCPRVQLKDKEDVYLSVCVFGQYKKTQCVPPIFPLVFNARMVFEKVFPEAIDPGDVVAQLEYDTAVFELIQLVLPVGETLSTYEENTRDFMFPGPKQMSGHHDSNRQVMMQRISGIRGGTWCLKEMYFSSSGERQETWCDGLTPLPQGLAPKMEFSTTSVITECLISSRKCRGLQGWASPPSTKPQSVAGAKVEAFHLQAQDKPSYHAASLERSHGRMQIRGPSRSSKKKSRSPERHKYCSNPRNYEQPTISSKSHSPSPYTKRRMCELSEDTRRRLAHLNLGPYEFKKDTDKPPFVIRHADPPSPKPEILLGPNGREPSREGWCKLHNELKKLVKGSQGHLRTFSAVLPRIAIQTLTKWQTMKIHSTTSNMHIQSVCGKILDVGRATKHHTHLGSYRSKDYKITKPSHGRDREDSLDRCEEYIASRQARPHHTDRALLVHSAPSSMQKRSPSPVLNQSTLRERYHSDWCSPSNSDEIHERVKNVLKSHGVHQRCLYDERDQEKDEELDLKRSFAYKDSVCDSDPEYSSVYRPRALVHLDNGEYWSNRAAAFKAKSHRGNFENSMDKIYRNLYRKACGSSTQESF